MYASYSRDEHVLDDPTFCLLTRQVFEQLETLNIQHDLYQSGLVTTIPRTVFKPGFGGFLLPYNKRN